MDRSTFDGFFITLLGGDEAAMLKLFEWMEGMLLTPEVKRDKAIALVGPPGCGKSAVIEVLRRMLGGGAVLQTTAPQQNVWGRFNGLMENALVVCIDQVTDRRLRSWHGELKMLITDLNIQVNEQPIRAVRSFHRVMLTTNVDLPFLDGARRINKIQCHTPSGDAEAQRAHFAAFYAMLDQATPDDLRQAVLSGATRLQWKMRAFQVEPGESATAYLKAVAKILNQSGDADAQAMVSSALLGSWAATNVPKSSLPADLARLVAASVLRSMLADAGVS